MKLCHECRKLAAVYPPWDRSKSDGCTFATELFHECCLNHDMAYWYGSCERCRKQADIEFLTCMLRKARTPVGAAIALVRYASVRVFGRWAYRKPHKRSPDCPNE